MHTMLTYFLEVKNMVWPDARRWKVSPEPLYRTSSTFWTLQENVWPLFLPSGGQGRDTVAHNCRIYIGSRIPTRIGKQSKLVTTTSSFAHGRHFQLIPELFLAEYKCGLTSPLDWSWQLSDFFCYPGFVLPVNDTHFKQCRVRGNEALWDLQQHPGGTENI